MDYSHFCLPYWNGRLESVWEVFILVFPLLIACLETPLGEVKGGQTAHSQCQAADENDQVEDRDALPGLWRRWGGRLCALLLWLLGDPGVSGPVSASAAGQRTSAATNAVSVPTYRRPRFRMTFFMGVPSFSAAWTCG